MYVFDEDQTGTKTGAVHHLLHLLLAPVQPACLHTLCAPYGQQLCEYWACQRHAAQHSGMKVLHSPCLRP